MHCERRALEDPDPFTDQPYGWTIQRADGRSVAWTGLQTGPLTFAAGELDALCHTLLGHGLERLEHHADQVLQPASGPKAERRPALLLHSTTPELRTFDGDLDALTRGRPGGDFTTYKEARSVYLARPGDVVVGRTRAWKAAVRATGVAAIEIEDTDHYYLSHALLHLAREYRSGTGSAIDHLIACVRDVPRVVRLYAIELEMQIFLLWLARVAGLAEIAVEANRPALSAAWNRKAVLHPTVARAVELGTALTGPPCLELESRHSSLAVQLGIKLPTVPGYTIERQDRSQDDFVRQVLSAADLLRLRHGLTAGCLKASESGDGARITPGIELGDSSVLTELGGDAYVHGDDYVLEAHVNYGRVSIAGQVLPTALSAHIRSGRVAPAATIQFVEGTSWKGNVLLDEHSLELFNIPVAHYRQMRRFMEDFRDASQQKAPGLVLAGIDFAVGTVGGAFGATVLLGVQDLNISFTGAECLRAFLDKAQQAKRENGHRYGVTRIYRPSFQADHHAFLRITRAFDRGPVYADTVASIPGRWAMVGITGSDPRAAVENLNRLEGALVAAGLVEK